MWNFHPTFISYFQIDWRLGGVTKPDGPHQPSPPMPLKSTININMPARLYNYNAWRIGETFVLAKWGRGVEPQWSSHPLLQSLQIWLWPLTNLTIDCHVLTCGAATCPTQNPSFYLFTQNSNEHLFAHTESNCETEYTTRISAMSTTTWCFFWDDIRLKFF